VGPKPQDSGLEELVGRYGTMIAATIMLLVGVGVLLSWAIRSGLLGPTARVVLGYLAAAIVAGIGIRLRLRGTREFGNILLAMALGVVHLVCWSAGPQLHVMPSAAALFIGLAASAALAEFALRHDEQALCAIGFGGAAIAPFATNDGSGNVVALAAYGAVVIVLSAAALRDRDWSGSLAVTLGSLFVYLIACVSGYSTHAPLQAIASRLGVFFPLVVLIGVIPLVHARHRRLLVRAATGAVALGGIVQGREHQGSGAVLLIAVAAVIGIGALDAFREDAVERDDAAARDASSIPRLAMLDAFLLPMALFLAAIAAAPGMHSNDSIIVGVVWAVLAGAMSHRNRAEQEADFYASTAALTALWIVPAAVPEGAVYRPAAAAAMGVLLLLVCARIPRQPFAFGGLASLAIGSLWMAVQLEQRLPYSYAPFATDATLIALLVVGGWEAARRVARTDEFLRESADGRKGIQSATAIGVASTVFLWGHGELDGAWNVTASTALLILYYAASGTIMIWLGRRRQVGALRGIGLLLALVAAGKALVQAFEVPNIAVRMAIFFAVSAFLIAIGYWYRKGGPSQDDAAAPSVAA